LQKSENKIQMNGGTLGDEFVCKWARHIMDGSDILVLSVQYDRAREPDPLRPAF
jgi:hypothetical protein